MSDTKALRDELQRRLQQPLLTVDDAFYHADWLITHSDELLAALAEAEQAERGNWKDELRKAHHLIQELADIQHADRKRISELESQLAEREKQLQRGQIAEDLLLLARSYLRSFAGYSSHGFKEYFESRDKERR